MGISKGRVSGSSNPTQARFQLRAVLILFFLALAVPLLLLFQRIYWQLENEMLFQLRSTSDELVSRINTRLQEILLPEETRPFDEYNFYKVDQIPLQASKGLIYSPLSEYPPKNTIPGLIGYFQVNPDGSLQSPIVPKLEEGEVVPTLAPDELARRIRATDQLYSLLSEEGPANGSVSDVKQPAMVSDKAPSKGIAAPKPTELNSREIAKVVLDNRVSSQQVMPERLLESKNSFLDNAQKVTDLNLDSKYLPLKRKKSKEDASFAGGAAPQPETNVRERRREKVDLAVSAASLEDAPQKSDDTTDELQSSHLGSIEEKNIPLPGSLAGSEGRIEAKASESDVRGQRKFEAPENAREAKKMRTAVRVLTLEGEVDPFQFKVLDPEHFLFVRKVWRNGQRYLQGFVTDGDALVRDLIATPFQGSSVSQNSTLIVGYQGVYFKRLEGEHFSSSTKTDREIVLQRSTLAAPFDDVELLFTTPQLPVGPGASAVNALAYVIVSVLLLGFFGVYALGLGQISLAKERSDFVSAVSHELRTPLTSIRMYSEMLRADWVMDDAKKRTYYDYIFRESERLSRLIANVLQFSKLANTSAELELKLSSPKLLLDLARQSASSQAEAAGFALAVSYDDRRPEASPSAVVQADEDAFQRICINLVDNALKFSAASERKEIVISMRVDEQEAHFSVRDFGPGVPRTEMKNIFKLFYRAEDEMSRTTKGTGIGLALVRELASKMNARVDLRNMNPGAEFCLKMPLVRQEAN